MVSTLKGVKYELTLIKEEEKNENRRVVELLPLKVFPLTLGKTNTVMCLGIGTPINNKFSICPKWKMNYYWCPKIKNL